MSARTAPVGDSEEGFLTLPGEEKFELLSDELLSAWLSGGGIFIG